MKFNFGRKPKGVREKPRKKKAFFKPKPKKEKKTFFGKAYKKPKPKPKPKPAKIGGQRVFENEKKPPKKGSPTSYKFSVMKTKDQRVRTFNSREEAKIHLNKLKETQPGFRYKIISEKQPNKKWF